MKKIISLFMLLLIVIGFSPTNASASTLVTPETKIKLNEVYVTVPYDSNTIEVKHEINEYEATATIIDKQTGEVLDVFGELIENNNIQPRGYYYTTVYRDKTVGPAKARLYARLYCYNYNSFRQLNKVDSTWWAEASSGNWVLERENTFGYVSNANSSGVGTKAYIEGTANIVVTTTSSTTGSFSISALEKLGYEVSHAFGSTYYARTPIQFSYYYSLY